MRPLYSVNPILVKWIFLIVFSLVCVVSKFTVDWFFRILYNLYIDRKETEMTDNEFFKLDQELWFQEYVESELSKNIGDTDIQIENFFLDVPF